MTTTQVGVQKTIIRLLKKESGHGPDMTPFEYEGDIGNSFIYEVSYIKNGKLVDITMEYFVSHNPDITVLLFVDGDKKLSRRIKPHELGKIMKKIRSTI